MKIVTYYLDDEKNTPMYYQITLRKGQRFWRWIRKQTRDTGLKVVLKMEHFPRQKSYSGKTTITDYRL